MITVEIIVTGNEVLLGDVLDTNTNWVCRRITAFGGRVERVVIVRDEIDAIVREIRSGLERPVRLIITIGGMGPTWDDVTVAAVARAVHHPLTLHPRALAIVQQRYEHFAREGAVSSAKLTSEREKMAHLPEGAYPIDNPIGAAPGVVLDVRDSTIICLPGVPAELKGIFEGPLQPLLRQLFGERVFIEYLVLVNCTDESTLAPVLRTVAEHHPAIYVKSRAQRFGSDVKFRVTLSTTGHSRESAEQQIAAAIQRLEQTLSAVGIAIDAIEKQ
ncbi:MAG: competence/damage-inducible protein A [Roseiflexus sp.]